MSAIAIDQVVEQLQRIAGSAKIFQSMPWIPGITPRYLSGRGVTVREAAEDRLERRSGIFSPDVATVSPFDHGFLYGDGVFEGTRFADGRALLHREHIARLFRSAVGIGIRLPYTPIEFAQYTLDAIRETGLENGYVRTVCSRGIGDLGINPKKSPEATVTIIASTIQLYAQEFYERGLAVSIARHTRRVDDRFLNPGIKSTQYLNNIFGLLETSTDGTMETIMLTAAGNLAEATADNLFIIRRDEGWQEHPERVHLDVPAERYALAGTTRAWVIDHAKRCGYEVRERDDLLTHDLVRPGAEVFLTGTGAMLIPMTTFDCIPIGDGKIGPITKNFLESYRSFLSQAENGISVRATPEQLHAYMAR